jgi:hypothetical protein
MWKPGFFWDLISRFTLFMLELSSFVCFLCIEVYVWSDLVRKDASNYKTSLR